MKNDVIKVQKNVTGSMFKTTTFYLLLVSMSSAALYATRTYIPSENPDQTSKEQTSVQSTSGTTAAASLEKLKALCDKIGFISESAIQRYSELKNVKDELYKALKNNSQRDVIFKDGRVDCIALKGIVDPLNKDEIAHIYQLLAQCEKLKEKKAQNIKKAVNEIRKAHGDSDELRSIENEIQVIESAFVDLDTALRRLDAHEEGMNTLRSTQKTDRKKDRGMLTTAKKEIRNGFGVAKHKAGSALEKTKEFLVGSDKTTSRKVQQEEQYRGKESEEVLTQHKDIVERSVEDARRDIEALSDDVVDLRKEAVDLYRQAIEKEVLAQQKAAEKADDLREQAEQLTREAEFLLQEADELERKSREGL